MTDGGPFLESRTCIWLPRSQLAPQTLLPSLGPHQGTCLRAWTPHPVPHHALHRVGDVQRVWGATGRFTTLEGRLSSAASLAQPCRRACALLIIQLPQGKIICLSWNNIPLVVRERVGVGCAEDEHPPVVAGSGTEDLFILEQGRDAEVARWEH